MKKTLYDFCMENKDKKYLLEEWHYEKNKIKPTEVTKASNKKVWWKCKKGHEWETTINNRTNNRGCPYCSGHKVMKGFNDLLSQKPEIAKEWNYGLNGELNPDAITVYSSKKVWWKCKSGHIWKTSIAHRTLENTNCPYCFSERQTSFPEQAIHYYIKQVFPDTINNYEVGGRFKLDIFIPSLSVGIEYDGSAWHQNTNKDIRKNKICENKKITLIRVREEGCPEMKNSSFLTIVKCKALDDRKRIFDIDTSIKNIFKVLEKLSTKKILIDINSEKDKNIIFSTYKRNKFEKSLKFLRPDLMEEWDYEANSGLDPATFTLGSQIKVSWVCSKGHKYQTAISTRTKTKIGCPYCTNQKALEGYNDLKTWCIENNKQYLLKEWNYDLNGELKPENVTAYSNKRVWWKCKNGHEWENVISTRTCRNLNCPYCSGHKALEGYNDLKTWCIKNNKPYLLEEWNYEKNKIKPTEVTKASNKKVWWKCKNGHEWNTKITTRTSKTSKCPYCNNLKALEGYNDLKTWCIKNNKQHLLEEWDYELNGELKPENETIRSSKKVWWKCKNGHSWKTSITRRINYNFGCKNCNIEKLSKKVRNIDTGEIFNSLKEAAKSCNYKDSSTISNCCKGKLKTAGGYHWEFL